MKNIKLGLFACVVIYSLLFAANNTYAKEKPELPRSFGPLYLGMTENSFYKMLGLKSYACNGCTEHESTSAIDVQKYPKLFPDYIYKHRGIDCFFFKGQLYRIELPTQDDTQIDVVRKKYSNKYGPPNREEHWENGLSWVIWEDNKTILSVNFVKRQGKHYPLTLPVGTVVAIEYIDKALNSAVLKERKKEKRKK